MKGCLPVRLGLVVATLLMVWFLPVNARAEEPPKIGDPVVGDAWQLTVLSARTAPSLKENSLGLAGRTWRPAEGYVFLVVEVELMKLSDEPQSYDSDSSILTDRTSAEYRSVGTSRGPGGSWGYQVGTRWSKTISGTSPLITERWVYVVPIDAQGFTLSFLDLPTVDLGR